MPEWRGRKNTVSATVAEWAEFRHSHRRSLLLGVMLSMVSSATVVMFTASASAATVATTSEPMAAASTAAASTAAASTASTAGDEPPLTDIFRNTLTCALVEPLLADMPVVPLYAQEDGICLSKVPDETVRDYFSDAGCESPIAFEPTALDSHCELLLDSELLGEGQGIESPVWTLSPGSRLDVGARSLEGVLQPYLQRQIYRTVQTANGECSLEMRIYAPSPLNESVQRPSLLALHGGSWSARGFGFFGLEMTIPHYVNEGFVVYAPFYRLLGDSEGSAACNQASIGQISEDAAAALAWVREHATEFGSSPVPVVFGQSAGAHLATSLSVNDAESVAGAVLFYPPTDFTDFALRAQQGFYTDEQGLGILESLLGVSAGEADVSATPIPENSFPQRIVRDGIDTPPMFMVHGMQDNLVEARQSVRLCDALAGRELLALDVEVSQPDSLREVIQCGAESQLQLIREGQHALDVCVATVALATELCPSGSEASRVEVANAIGDAVAFAIDTARVALDLNSGLDGGPVAPAPGDIDSSQRSGGAAGSGLLLLLGLIVLLRYHPRAHALRVETEASGTCKRVVSQNAHVSSSTHRRGFISKSGHQFG